MINSIFKEKRFILFLLIQNTVALLVTELIKRLQSGIRSGLIMFLMSFSFYLFIYILPVLIYLKFIDKVNTLDYLKLNSNGKSGIIKGMLIGSFIFIVLLIKNRFVLNRQVYLASDIIIVLGKILVGPLEEIPFRGFYMQKLNKHMNFWKANIISSIIFALIHIPNFISGAGINLYPVVVIMIVGFWMGYIFKETGSLWCAAIAHSIYDLAIWIIL